jgi:hypothetical protein
MLGSFIIEPIDLYGVINESVNVPVLFGAIDDDNNVIFS